MVVVAVAGAVPCNDPVLESVPLNSAPGGGSPSPFRTMKFPHRIRSSIFDASHTILWL